MGTKPWVIPRIGKSANISMRLMIAYTATALAPSNENRMLFTKRTVKLTTACRAKVTKPRLPISLTTLD